MFDIVYLVPGNFQLFLNTIWYFPHKFGVKRYPISAGSHEQFQYMSEVIVIVPHPDHNRVSPNGV